MYSSVLAYRSAYVLGAVLLSLMACGSRRVGGAGSVANPTSSVSLGDCANPARDGVVGGRDVRLERADRDLDGDGVEEWVSVDRSMCSDDGNCYWNIFSGRNSGSCRRYMGTIAGSGIELLPERGERGFADLRSWWTLSGGGRFLLQQYRFESGGYRVIDALVCRSAEDDRLLCAQDGT